MLSKKYINKFLFYFSFLLLILFQISFVQNISSIAYYLNLVLIILLLLLFRKATQKLFIGALLAGFIYDLYSRFAFGTYLFTFCITFLILYLISKRIFTSYANLNSLSLVTLGSILWQVIPWLLTKIVYLLNLNDYYMFFSWKKLFIFTIINVMVLMLIQQIGKKLGRQIWTKYETS